MRFKLLSGVVASVFLSGCVSGEIDSRPVGPINTEAALKSAQDERKQTNVNAAFTVASAINNGVAGGALGLLGFANVPKKLENTSFMVASISTDAERVRIETKLNEVFGQNVSKNKKVPFAYFEKTNAFGRSDDYFVFAAGGVKHWKSSESSEYISVLMKASDAAGPKVSVYLKPEKTEDGWKGPFIYNNGAKKPM